MSSIETPEDRAKRIFAEDKVKQLLKENQEALEQLRELELLERNNKRANAWRLFDNSYENIKNIKPKKLSEFLRFCKQCSEKTFTQSDDEYLALKTIRIMYSYLSKVNQKKYKKLVDAFECWEYGY